MAHVETSDRALYTGLVGNGGYFTSTNWNGHGSAARLAGALIREIQHERRKLVAAFEETGTPPPRACRLIQGGTARFHESLNFLIDVRDHPLDENEAITEGLIRAVASYCVEELKGLARKENEMRTRWRDCKPEMKKSALYVRAAAEKPWKMIPADI